jgi:hypothetical protein
VRLTNTPARLGLLERSEVCALWHSGRRVLARVDATDRLVTIVRQQLRQPLGFLMSASTRFVLQTYWENIDVAPKTRVILGDSWGLR